MSGPLRQQFVLLGPYRVKFLNLLKEYQIYYSFKAPLLCAPKHIDPNIFDPVPCYGHSWNFTGILGIWLTILTTLSFIGFGLTWVIIYRKSKLLQTIFQKIKII